MESFVAMMALSAACVLDPGIYFAMNSPAAVIGNTPQRAAEVISSWGWVITPETITQTAADVGEHTILNRAGGAPTLAVGMAQIMAQAFGGKALEPFWYHFAILFEALFILTAVDAGTRAGRFMIQDLLGHDLRAARPHRVGILQRGRHGAVRRRLGLVRLSGHRGSARRREHDLAAVRHLQPRCWRRSSRCCWRPPS